MTKEDLDFIGSMNMCDEISNEAYKKIVCHFEGQEPKTDYKSFCEWVASEIFNENWEYNKDAFAEIACRKLAKLGIVRAKGDEWELVEPQEREGKE